jgi:hypothetical protein
MADPNSMAFDLLQEHVPAMLARHMTSLRGMAEAAGVGPLDFAGEHRVYVAGLGDAVSQDILEKARPIGWRYFILSGDRLVATAQVSGRTGSDLSFSHVNYGGMASATAQALALAEERGQIEEGVDVRVLEIPGLYLVALWLKAKRLDVLIPLDPAPPTLRANTSYTAAEFLTLVAQLALRRVEQGIEPTQEK